MCLHLHYFKLEVTINIQILKYMKSTASIAICITDTNKTNRII